MNSERRWYNLIGEVNKRLREPTFKVENIVATVATHQKINLIKIIGRFPQAKYDPKRFPGLIYKLQEPKTAVLIFDTGKMVCTGGKSISQVHEAVEKVVISLESKEILHESKFTMKVVNIVASGELHGDIDMERAAVELGSNVLYDEFSSDVYEDELGITIYEPSEFPALIYHIREPRAVFLLFANGKIVCVGAKKVEEVSEAVESLVGELRGKDLIAYREPE
ncbi:MAG: TATA box-binding protein [Nitrososphaeria archaeon]|nr:TATA box-binding protein [Nitrososphaeria archaeon]